MANCSIKNGKYFAPNGEESLLYKTLKEKVGEEEAHDLFVISKTPSFIREAVAPLIRGHMSKLIKIPDNVAFKEEFVNKIRTFQIFQDKKNVGRIQLTPHKDGFKVKSSLVKSEFRGEGFGAYLYNYAIYSLIRENNTLYSDKIRTEDADRVWRKLSSLELSLDGRTVKPLPKDFDSNGEVKSEVLLNYIENNYTQNTPLSTVEKTHLINLQIADVETSDELYEVLYDAFYENTLFSPNVDKLSKIYTEYEIEKILESSEIQGRIRETIEKLRHTEEFTIPRIAYKKEFDIREDKVNIIGQSKKKNPLRAEKEFKEKDYPKIPVMNEKGEAIKTQMFYLNAIKSPSRGIIESVRTLTKAHPFLDTTKTEEKIVNLLKNYGLDIKGISRENFSKLLDFLEFPSEESRRYLEDALGFVRKPLTTPIDIAPIDRSYQYINTTKSEQELFDELSLIKTNIPNVYHKVGKIGEQEMRDIQENQDLTIPMYELYKDYYGYGLSAEQTKPTQTNIETDINYLLEDFISDFAVEKIKKPTEFNRQFKITNKGIELISDDVITLEIVKAYIKEGTKFGKEMADYSLLSKEMPNLKEKSGIENKRAVAVNNIESVAKPKTEVTILDEESIFAPKETEPFLRIGNDVYEQQEQGYYNKLEKNDNPLFYNLNPQAPQYKEFKPKKDVIAEIKTKKLTSKEIDKENFDCI
jgi:hypothetical protein